MDEALAALVKAVRRVQDELLGARGRGDSDSDGE